MTVFESTLHSKSIAEYGQSMGGWDLGAVVQQRAAKGVVVPTSFLTRNAIATAGESRHVSLRDQKALLTWIDSLPHSHDR
jgi:hypothetical protein